jgi:chorismate dehydratase
LEMDAAVELALDVPSRLLSGLREGRFDVALLPVIDYQRMEGLRLIPAGGIGCDGPTLTVRIFSKRPVGGIHTLACDPDSHTSVALARIVLGERYGVRPEFTALRAGDHGGEEAKLLIGDKVACEEPDRSEYPYQMDLGEEWKGMTKLPFVFAAWMARGDVDLGELPARLERAKREGLEHVDEIIEKDAVPRGWSKDVARQYLTENLKFDVGPRQVEAMGVFYRLAVKYAVIEAARELVIA